MPAYYAKSQQLSCQFDLHCKYLQHDSNHVKLQLRRCSKVGLGTVVAGRDIHIECSKQFKRNLCVWAEQAVLGNAKTALKFKYEIQIG